MKKFTTNELRAAFVDYFAGKGHKIITSASLVPIDDPTLLWINCGMAPLKPYFSGQQIPENPRMANSQKCIRTNDIENVGKTARHHTFFEMLGNFSIGDYFKEESLKFGWEFFTEVVGIDKDRLWVTIHPEDDEAYRIWTDVIGISRDRIVRSEENFWDIGPGPCGPNSEIYVDQGEAFSCGSPDCGVGCDCDRYLEVWNHVFSQYNHNADGSRTPLPRRNIDTGMSLERLAVISQGVASNYEIDLFQPIMHALENMTNLKYAQKQPHTMAFNVIADHLRTVTFAISDGAMPSNEGRGYVIRRLLRRAVRFGKTIGLNDPFLHGLVDLVVKQMGQAYPEIAEKQDLVERIIRIEEERFNETLDEGVNLLNGMIDELKTNGETVLSGPDAFRLYDTFGFPLDLTEDVAGEHGVTVDRHGFELAMAEQRERARAARGETESDFGRKNIYRETPGGNVFIGYEFVQASASVIAISLGDELVQHAESGIEVGLLFDQTVFYAESGGQVSDIGWITTQNAKLKVINCVKVSGDKILHRCIIEEGSIKVGDKVHLQLDNSFRQAVRRAHSATHLLHKALQEVLGEHAHQAGSLVESEHLRFDFSHFSAVQPEELRRIEQRVNEQILAALPVDTTEMSVEQAKAKGATALFGEKYGDTVRVVTIGDYSMELCGGTHVSNVGEIGQFRLLSESGIGAGLRRIEAIVGMASYHHVSDQQSRLLELADMLKSSVDEAPRRLDGTLQALKEARREIERLEGRLAAREADAFVNDAPVIDGVKVITRQVIAKDMDSLRSVADTVKDKAKSGVIVLGAVVDEKVNLVAVVTDDLLGRKLHAGNLIKEVARMTGGGGGGRPNMAQAGGKDPDKLSDALNQVVDLVKKQLGIA